MVYVEFLLRRLPSRHAQPFFDRNKRTGRLAMNYELLRNGFEGIVGPAEGETEYVAAVAEIYRSGGCRGLC